MRVPLTEAVMMTEPPRSFSSGMAYLTAVSYTHLDVYKRQKVEHTPAYDTRRPTPAERRRQQLLVLFQMTYIGAPMIYYGDEAGMWGANDPCDRKPMVWPEMEYEPEATLPDGRPRPQADEVAFDHDLHDFYRTLITIRQASPALRRGDYRTLLADDDRRLFAFARQTEDDAAIVVLNADDLMQVAELDVPAGTWSDALSGERHVTADGRLSLTDVYKRQMLCRLLRCPLDADPVVCRLATIDLTPMRPKSNGRRHTSPPRPLRA